MREVYNKMRKENNFNIKRLWLSYKIINFYKIYICIFMWNKKRDFVIFKIDYIENKFFTIMLLNFTLYMSYEGETKRFFLYKEKKFKILLKKLNDNKY
jgi:hypothetical protein